MTAIVTEGRLLVRLLRRPLLWVLLILTAAGAVAAYQVRHAYVVDVGSPADDPYVRNFHDPLADTVQGRTFRWSDTYSYVALPGIGGGLPYSITLDLNPGRITAPLTLLVNGETFLQTNLRPGWHTYTVQVDAQHPAALASRDLLIELRGPGSGIMVDRVSVSAFGPGFVAPTYAQLAYLLAIVLLVYLLLGRLLSANPAPRRRAGVVPLIGATLVAVILVGLLAMVHVPLTAISGALAAGLVGAYVVLVLGWQVRGWLGGEARIIGRLLAQPLLWGIVALALVGAVAAYQPRHAYDIDVGSPADQAYVLNFRDRELDDASERLYRHGGADTYFVMPGLGGGVPYSVTVTLNPGHPDIPLTINLNGETYLEQTLPNGWQTFTFSVDAAHPQALAAPDLVLEFRPPPTVEILLDRVQVTAGGLGFVVPAWDQLAYLAALVVLAYLLIGRALAGSPWARVVPASGAVLTGAVLVGLLAAVHGPLTVATPHLVTTGVVSYVLLVLAEPLARRLVPGPAWAARVAAVLVAGAFLTRYGAMALPQTIVIDMTYHMRWLRELLNGNWAALTDPHGGLNKPPRRWGLGLYIPKSPLFYIVVAPLAWLPGDLELLVQGFICLLEASTVLFCYVLLARLAPALGSWRAGLWAGFAYAANPLAFRALSYGILPTILAQWLSVAFFTLLLLWAQSVESRESRVESNQGPALENGTLEWNTDHGPRNTRLRQAGVWAVMLALLTAALIAFPTVAVFDTMVLGGLALVWLGRHRRRLGLAVIAVTAVAWIASLIIYYGLYVPDMINNTLPLLLGPASGSAGGGTPATSTVHWDGPLDLLNWTYTNLVSAVPLLTGLGGTIAVWVVAWRARRRVPGTVAGPERLLAPLLLCWVAILPIFIVVNYRVDMIAKHLFYTMVPLALGSGIFFWLLARQGRSARVVAGVVAGALVWVALVFWFAQLVPATI